MGELLFIIALVGCLVGWTFFLSGKARKMWLITMSIIGSTVGIMEIISMCINGMTISQLYWSWSCEHPVTSYFAMGMYLVGNIVLVVHLMWKQWTDPTYHKEPK